jgi:inosine-uridine nucleoside N-ribohydrolase
MTIARSLRTAVTLIALLIAATCHGQARTAVWIDTDPSIGAPWREVDDAFALLFAFASPELEIVGLSSTYGNAGVRRTTTVARDLAHRFGAAAPVFEGASSPQDHAARSAATDALARQLQARKLTYVALGPLTNLAAFLQLHPHLARNINRVIIVGGQSPDRPPRFGPKRSHRIHDANVFKDPASAAKVLQAGIPITLAAIDTARQLALTRSDLEQLRDGAPAARFLYSKTRVWLWFWTNYVREPGALVFDVLAVLPAIKPRLLNTEKRFAKVDDAGNLIAFRSREPNTHPVQFSTGVHADTKRLLLRRLRQSDATRL